jgi:hypothetical protein
MRCDTNQPPVSCGIDLHARSMYVCLVHRDGAILMPRHRKAAPAPCLTAIAPSRAGLGVAVEGLLTWYGLAALWTQARMAFGLGHALSMQALHGGKAKNDQRDSQRGPLLKRRP